MTRAHLTVTDKIENIRAGELAFEDNALSFCNGDPIFSETTVNGEKVAVCVNAKKPHAVLATTDDGQPDLIESYVDVWDDDIDYHNAQKIEADSKGVGIVITIPEGGCLYEAAVQAPSYSDNIGNLTIKIFAWNTDYATTIAAEPVYAEEFVDFTDNGTLTCEFEEGQIGAGRYLIVACDAVDAGAETDPANKGVGVWMGKPFKATTMPEEYAKYEIESWIDGVQNKKTIGKFALIILELEEQ